MVGASKQVGLRRSMEMSFGGISSDVVGVPLVGSEGSKVGLRRPTEPSFGGISSDVVGLSLWKRASKLAPTSDENGFRHLSSDVVAYCTATWDEPRML